MAQIRNFGFVAHIQEPDVQHPPRPCGRIGQQRGQSACAQHALCHPHHSGADGQGFGGNLSFGNDHLQQSDGAVSAL